MSRIGLLHPGAMGASIGAQLTSKTHTVLWWPEGRSERSAKRAEQAGLTPSSQIDDWLTTDYIISICPPAAAESIAQSVIDWGYQGTLIEANAISPMRLRDIAKKLEASGVQVIDGSVIGGPVWPGEGALSSVLACSGKGADAFAALFEETGFEGRVVSTELGNASSLKMVFAALTKGSIALIAEILNVAEQLGVRSELEKLWGDQATQQRHNQVSTNAAKAWRFAGEMREISQTFSEVDAAPGFHEASAQVFERLESHKDWVEKPSLDALLTSLSSQDIEEK